MNRTLENLIPTTFAKICGGKEKGKGQLGCIFSWCVALSKANCLVGVRKVLLGGQKNFNRDIQKFLGRGGGNVPLPHGAAAFSPLSGNA